MIFSMTGKKTTSCSESLIFEPQKSAWWRRDYCSVKIDKIRIIGAVTLCWTDSMRIMTSIAGSSVRYNMPIMFLKWIGTVQNVCPVMTTVTQFICRSRFNCSAGMAVILHVLQLQYLRINITMWSRRFRSIITGMAGCTINDRCWCIRGN